MNSNGAAIASGQAQDGKLSGVLVELKGPDS